MFIWPGDLQKLPPHGQQFRRFLYSQINHPLPKSPNAPQHQPKSWQVSVYLGV